MKVRDIMTKSVISISEQGTIEDAARLLARHRISGLPVVNSSDVLVGLVTEHDLIAKDSTGEAVTDIMSRDVISVGPDTDADQVTHLLTNQRIRRVPVVEGGKVIGIVSRSDLVRQIAMRWVCNVCGHVERGGDAPKRCSNCSAPQSAFTHEMVQPGM